MPRYLITPSAKADVREIIAYLRERSPQAAVHVRNELKVAMRKLAMFPWIGHRRADVHSESLRFWSVYSYLIAYHAEKKPIEIIRVFHGARNVGKLPMSE